VTDHGVPVAKIVSVGVGGTPLEISELVRANLMEYRAPVLDELDDPVPMPPGEKTAADYVREQRR
jgi:hypothetical protein